MPAAGDDPTSDTDPHAFAAAADEAGFDAVFSPTTSDAEARWYEMWVSTSPAATRAVALALALAARTATLAGL